MGINTDTPTETLNVKGTAKVEELPESGVGKIYNGASNDQKNTTFTGTRTVVADDNGVLGYVSGLPGSSGSTVNPTDPKSVAYANVNRCTRGAFTIMPGSTLTNQVRYGDAPDGNVSKETEITLDGISLRYNLGVGGVINYAIQIKTDTSRLVSLVGPGLPNSGRFITTSSVQWTNVVPLNHDVEAWIIGTLVFHNEGTMYRYTAQGWKQSSNTPSGFCHALERIGRWDGTELQGTEG